MEPPFKDALWLDKYGPKSRALLAELDALDLSRTEERDAVDRRISDNLADYYRERGATIPLAPWYEGKR